MSREDGDTSILNKIISQASKADNNAGVAFWRGALSTLVIHKGEGITDKTLSGIKEMLKLTNISDFYLDENEFENLYPTSLGEKFTLDQIIQEIITELNTQCHGPYIGKRAELVHRVLQLD